MGEFESLFDDEAWKPGARSSHEPGNIDVMNRPHVRNADGSVSTVRSASFNLDGKEVLLPTVSEDGRIMSDDEAVAQYQKTGRHLGKFSSPAEATAFAQRLHDQQAAIAELPPRGSVDMGPAARRARDTARGPRDISDEEAGVATGPLHSPDAVSVGGARVTPMGAKPYPVTMGAEEQGALPASTYDMTQAQRQGYLSSLAPQDAADVTGKERGDFAKFLLGGAAGGVAGAGVGGAVATKVPMLAPIAGGAAAGAASSAATGGDIGTGALVGGALGIPGAMYNVGQAALKARQAAGTMSDIGNMPGADKESIARLGAQKTDEIARRFGVVGAPDPVTAHNGIKAGVADTGAKIGAAYDALGTVGARPSRSLAQTTDRATRALSGSRAGKVIADAVEDEIADIRRFHGKSATDVIPLKALREELTKAQNVGFSGAKFDKLSDSGKAAVAREVADVLRTEIDAGLSVAGQDPKLRPVVQSIHGLNSDYHALKVLDDSLGRAAAKSQFTRDPTIGERIQERLPKIVGGAPMPKDAREIKAPSGKTMGRVPGEAPAPAGAPAPFTPALAASLSKKDEDGLRTLLAGELFGR